MLQHLLSCNKSNNSELGRADRPHQLAPLRTFLAVVVTFSQERGSSFRIGFRLALRAHKTKFMTGPTMTRNLL